MGDRGREREREGERAMEREGESATERESEATERRGELGIPTCLRAQIIFGEPAEPGARKTPPC